MSEPTSTRYGRDVHDHVPDASQVTGVVALSSMDDAIWHRAAPHLRVRDNDGHTLHAYGIARALLVEQPDADGDVVRAAILLHDTGWSTVPEDEILSAIAPGGGRPDLVRQHEIEGARIAREILGALEVAPDLVERVAAIVDGHDSTREARSLEDAIVKDADKLWRVTPHGIGVVRGWFGLDHDEAVRLTASRVHGAMCTEEGRVLARGFTAVASIAGSPQLRALDGGPTGQ